MCVCVSHVCGSEAIRGHRIPGNWNPCSFELPCGCWESEFGPLRSLQLLFFPFLSALICLLFLHWLLLLTTHVLEAAAGAQDGLAFVTTFMEECSLCSSSVKLCSAAEHTTRHWCSFCARSLSPRNSCFISVSKLKRHSCWKSFPDPTSAPRAPGPLLQHGPLTSVFYCVFTQSATCQGRPHLWVL